MKARRVPYDLVPAQGLKMMYSRHLADRTHSPLTVRRAERSNAASAL